ncbi:MAG: [acyl-carrier-protein] S-malonyltransferase [Betaproteobacteria bacterium]|nr:[acyl-carrier-protein] S-malonyltransferase [Betaproteobacteria bacterium]
MSIAFVFPGQGSQSVGMLDVWVQQPEIDGLLRDADEALGEPLCRLIHEGPADKLASTVNTQPAMLLAGVCAWRAWQALGGPPPHLVAGHSLGEYAALVAAGVFRPSDALRLVRLRALAMQEAVPEGSGAMAAILGLEDAAVIESCAIVSAQSGQLVEAVNFNAPSQVVIAGHKAAVDLACEALKARGAKRALPLAVSAPFHSSLLRPAGDRLAQALEDCPMAEPRTPVIHNVDVQTHPDTESIKQALVKQAFHPVRWVETIQAMRERGIDTVIEMGPGKVLSGLVSRIDKHLRVLSVYDPSTLELALASLGRPRASSSP